MFRYHVVSSSQDIDHRLHAHDLRCRSDKGGISQVRARLREFSINLIDPVKCLLFPQLVNEIGNHPSGDLVLEDLGVDHRQSGRIEKISVLGSNGFKVFIELEEMAQVESRVPLRFSKGHDKRFDCRRSGTQGQRCKRCIDDVNPRLYGLQIGHTGHATGEMRMNLNGDMNCFLECLDEFVGVIRSNKPGHVLDAQAVDTHVFEYPGFVEIILKVVNWAAHLPLGERVTD